MEAEAEEGEEETREEVMRQGRGIGFCTYTLKNSTSTSNVTKRLQGLEICSIYYASSLTTLRRQRHCSKAQRTADVPHMNVLGDDRPSVVV